MAQQEHDDDGGEQGSHGFVSPMMAGDRQSVLNPPSSINTFLVAEVLRGSVTFLVLGR